MNLGIAAPGTVIQSTVDATWAEQQLARHNANRAQLGLRRSGSYASPYDANVDRAPPSFLDEGRPQSGRPDRRAARFRDGRPPPPAPPPKPSDGEIAAVLRAAGLDPTNAASIDVYAEGVRTGQLPTLDEARVILKLQSSRSMAARAAQLRPQDEVDGHPGLSPGVYPPAPTPAPYTNSRAPQHNTLDFPELVEYARPRSSVVATPVLAPMYPPPAPEAVPQPHPGGQWHTKVVPPEPEVRMARSGALTPSQKRRLRRRRAREGGEAEPSVDPADRDLDLDLDLLPADLLPAPTHQNGHGVYDIPVAPPTPTGVHVSTCGHAIDLYIAHLGGWVPYVCEIQLVPHPGQPHLVQAPRAYLDGAEQLFVGWYAPGE